MRKEYDFSQGTKGEHASRNIRIVGDTRFGKGPHPELIKILEPAYQPCPAFKTACTSMRFSPETGHVPRGFCGATARLDEVELVLVVAEPGDPEGGETHTGLLKLFRGALVVAFGKKTQRRLLKIGFTDFLAAWSPAPPGCNQTKARDSWHEIPHELARRRRSV